MMTSFSLEVTLCVKTVQAYKVELYRKKKKKIFKAECFLLMEFRFDTGVFFFVFYFSLVKLLKVFFRLKDL